MRGQRQQVLDFFGCPALDIAQGNDQAQAGRQRADGLLDHRAGLRGDEPLLGDGVPAIGIQDVLENRFGLSWKWNVTPEKAEALKRFTIPSAVTQNRPMRVT